MVAAMPPPLDPATLLNFTPADRHVLDVVRTGAAALSLVGSAFVVLCYLLFKELHKFSFKLVFFLALSDMLCSFFSIVGDPSNGFFCYAHDYSAQFFCVASFMWTTTIAFTLHRTVVKHKTDVEEFGSIFHLYVWGTSLAMSILRTIGSDYGRPGIGCWIQPASTGKVAHLITFYGPLWSAILYNGFTYYQVNRMLNNATRMAVVLGDRSNQLDMRADRKAVNRWGYFPLILIGSWAFATINRIYGFLYPGHKIFWLSFLDVGFAGLMGLFNSIAYGLNSSVRRAIAERLELWIPERVRKVFPTFSRQRDIQPENELVSLIVEGQK
ncbi:G-protein coupled receptor 1 [Rhynchospora pubera]|uniref:G-protein coupled receptor 1 n=1 Tax=Rhynchospora pubera TaxID=906938 RepID=A0AAV8H9Z6_9POAL|nr:G-protein coupled receptor 1 [Rhynchospora pubera]